MAEEGDLLRSGERGYILDREPSVSLKCGVEGCWEGMITRDGGEGVDGDGDVFWKRGNVVLAVFYGFEGVGVED